MMEMRKPTDASRDTTAGRLPSAPTIRQSGAQAPLVTARTERAPAPFRSRLFAVLLLFAIIPTISLTVIWAVTLSQTLPLVSAVSAWERVAASGEHAIGLVRRASLDSVQRQAIDAHEAELRESVGLAKRFGYIAPRAVGLVTAGAIVIVMLVAIGGSRVAGHFSRQLSRPLDELVGWTALLRSGRALPNIGNQRGAPEFEVLRSGMRTMAAELERGRQRALEAERADAFRESARRFAHELKNPLTPIRFAVDRLRRSAPPELRDTVEVLAEEASRLEVMARSFAQFGRLPDGPAAEVDMPELVAKIAHATIPDHFAVSLQLADGLPLITGYHEPLVRAVTNVMVNAVEACGADGQIVVRVVRDEVRGQPAVCVAVRDNGPGIAPAALEHIFDPYVTTKPGGTGLGLAIARQTIAAHNGIVEADSTVGTGTEIRFRLPINGTVGAPSGLNTPPRAARVTTPNGD